MNMRFEYLYRDAGNYKKWGDLIFQNENNYDANYLEQMARKVLIDSEFIIPEKARVPRLRFQEHVEKLDHQWNEFHAFSSTTEKPNDPCARDVLDFIESLSYASTI